MNQGEVKSVDAGNAAYEARMGRPLPMARVYWRHNYRDALMRLDAPLRQAADEARRIDVSAGVELELRAMRERVQALLLAAG